MKTGVRQIIVAMAAIAIAMSQASAQPQTLRVSLDGDLQSLDPVASSSLITRIFGLTVFDVLIAQDSRGVYRPQMLESWESSPDRMTWTFTLRPGLAWHDGSPVTAEDCVASIRRWSQRDGVGRLMMAATAALSVVDERRFTLQLARPYGFVVETLGKPTNNIPVMMPARLAATDPARNIPEVIGSGPYRFSPGEYRPGNRTVVLRNPAYRPRTEPADGAAGGKTVHFDRVEFISMPDPATKAAALQAGEIDFIQRAPFDYIPQFLRDRNITIGSGGGAPQYMGIFQFNQVQPPFNNLGARRAVQQLMDQREFLAAFGLPPGATRICYSLYTCDSPYSTDAGTAVLRDISIARARTLLREAGYAGEPAVVLDPTDVPAIHTIALVIADRMRQAGINVQVRSTDWSTIAQQRFSRNPVERGGWSVLPLIWSSEDLGMPLTNTPLVNNCLNYVGWACDDALKALMDAFTSESDPARQRELAAQIQARAHEVVNTVISGQFTVAPAYRSDLRDVLPIATPVFWNMRRVAR